MRPRFLFGDAPVDFLPDFSEVLQEEVQPIAPEPEICRRSLHNLIGDAVGRGRGKHGHSVAPNKAPTPAVSAIASAPQKVTRATDLQTGEPPARAANAPNSARKNNELPETTQTRAVTGTTKTSSRGKAAPTANVPADAKAA
jgi:cobalamin biosynthesis Mg chelatase CobN